MDARPLFERWKEALSLGYEARKRKILSSLELDNLNSRSRIGENLVAATIYLGFPEFGKENLDLTNSFTRAEELFMSIKEGIKGVNEERLTPFMNWPLERVFKL